MWLLGSQVSLPTFSIQNLCGPLLPENQRENLLQLHLSWPWLPGTFLFFFFVENSVVFNYTCSTSILNCSKFTDLWWYCFKILLQRKINSIQFHIYIPINSAKPPTGSRQVPVTNCNRRIFFSLSISLTNWSKNTAFNYIKISSTFEFFFFLPVLCRCQIERCKKHNRTEFCREKKNPQGLKASLKKVHV